VAWEDISRDPAKLRRYLDEFVHGVRDRDEYVARSGGLEHLRAGERMAAGVNYGY
jgi:glutaconate CoA-transferase subunit A